jgi:urease accessory protein
MHQPSVAAGDGGGGPGAERGAPAEAAAEAVSPEPGGAAAGADQAGPTPPAPWHAEARLQFHRDARGLTRHQGGASAPLKVQRGFVDGDGRCQLPLLHTAGGLVGGDRLSLSLQLGPQSRVLLTSVAAQKVYGSIGRSRRSPAGAWAHQELDVALGPGADLEWLPQELVLYGDGLYHQRCRVRLEPGASWLGAEVVRLGLTAAGEGLAAGRWRSELEIRRCPDPAGHAGTWELVDRFELGGPALAEAHGMAGQPVFGSLVWAAPEPLAGPRLADLLADCRADRRGLVGEMACGALEQGLVARYRGPSTTAARHWFTRLWRRIRAARGLAAPELPRVWPFQEEPLGPAEAGGAGPGPGAGTGLGAP